MTTTVAVGPDGATARGGDGGVSGGEGGGGGGGSGGGGAGTLRARLLVTAPKLWWPRGYGEAHLYELRASLCAAARVGAARGVSSAAARGAASDAGAADAGAMGGSHSDAGGAALCEEEDDDDDEVVVQRVGLRKVELVQQPAQPPAAGLPAGTSFFFRPLSCHLEPQTASSRPATNPSVRPTVRDRQGHVIPLHTHLRALDLPLRRRQRRARVRQGVQSDPARRLRAPRQRVAHALAAGARGGRQHEHDPRVGRRPLPAGRLLRDRGRARPHDLAGARSHLGAISLISNLAHGSNLAPTLVRARLQLAAISLPSRRDLAAIWRRR